MKVTVKYFASIRESVGFGSEVLQTTSASLGALRDELLARGAPYEQALSRGRAVRLALNQVISEESTALVEGCEVAFFPPVTGG